MAKPYRRKGSRFWWIAPWIQGKQVPQSSKEIDYARAERQLKILEGKIAANAPISPKTDRASFAVLLQLVRKDYKIKRRATLCDLEARIDRHINPAIGHLPAAKVTRDVITDYILMRQGQLNSYGRPPANATINRELAIIKRAFRLGFADGLVSAIPHIEMLEEDNVREGFFDEDEYRAVLDQLDPLLRDITVLAYHTGWREQSMLRLPWSRVDFATGVIRLDRAGTKNKKSTVFPINVFPELRSMLEARFTLTKEAEVRLGIEIPHVFHRDGKPVKSIWASWDSARSRAGLPHKLIHDFRRTAVRRLKKMGFPESEIMDMVGFKTRDMFNRYDITVEADILRTADEIAKRLGIIGSDYLSVNHAKGPKLAAEAKVAIEPKTEEEVLTMVAEVEATPTPVSIQDRQVTMADIGEAADPAMTLGGNCIRPSLTRTDTAVCIEGEGEKMIPLLAHERPRQKKPVPMQLRLNL